MNKRTLGRTVLAIYWLLGVVTSIRDGFMPGPWADRTGAYPTYPLAAVILTVAGITGESALLLWLLSGPRWPMPIRFAASFGVIVAILAVDQRWLFTDMAPIDYTHGLYLILLLVGLVAVSIGAGAHALWRRLHPTAPPLAP